MEVEKDDFLMNGGVCNDDDETTSSSRRSRLGLWQPEMHGCQQ